MLENVYTKHTYKARDIKKHRTYKCVELWIGLGRNTKIRCCIWSERGDISISTFIFIFCNFLRLYSSLINLLRNLEIRLIEKYKKHLLTDL